MNSTNRFLSIKKKRVGSKFKAPIRIEQIEKDWLVIESALFYLSTISAYVDEKEYPEHEIGQVLQANAKDKTDDERIRLQVVVGTFCLAAWGSLFAVLA